MEIIQDLRTVIESYYMNIIRVLPRLAIAIIVITIVLFTLRYLRRRLIKFISIKADDKLLVNFTDGILRTLNIVIGILLFLYIIGQAGLAGSVLGAATVSSVVIGFAFKDIAENFLAGVIMAFNRPFRIGDTVKTGDVEGNILEMSLRDTHIKTFDGKDVYVPNGQILKNPLYNYTIDGYLRKEFTLGIDYGSDVDESRAIIENVLRNAEGIIQGEKPPRTLISEFGASTLNIKVQFWIDTFDTKYSAVEVQSQLMKNILIALDQAGINLPGDIIELKNYQDSPLQTNSKNIA